MSALGTTIRQHRAKEGLRLKDIAEQAHVSLQMVGLVEKGARSFSRDTAKHLAKMLNSPSVYLAAAADVTGGYIMESLAGITSRAEAVVFALAEGREITEIIERKLCKLIGSANSIEREVAFDIAVEAGEAAVAYRELVRVIVEEYGLDPMEVTRKTRARLSQRGLTKEGEEL